ncbi:endonuclease/exonuclease/phosphatase family protein [Rufibacter sp. LB8]|uniref:endonuclease/exonuclease/phosphatase family protein n=1 Tax=Rufibacter sp. LB8 TaxID=2777781 RepID=UPI001CEF9659|nr:endonuclease/exonuclease/phosphatase family protein [Rufibacter sp. LB8]
MNRLTFLVSCFFVVLGVSACKTTTGANNQKETTLRVMSYNIRHGNPPSKPKFIDLDATIAVIRQQNPDLVALQEVDVHTKRSGGVDQAKIIAEKLGMYYFFGKALDYDGGDYGVAILSKFPLLDAQVVALPILEGTNAELRALALAAVQLPNGQKIWIGSTHLDEKGNPANRLAQLDAIAKVQATLKEPFLIAGDFNATPGSESIQRLDALFTRTCQDCAPTFPVINSTKAIDFIAYTPAARFTVKSHLVIQETYASDHLPIVAELGLK